MPQTAPDGTPRDERGGRLRGVIDLLAGRYPSFMFGFGVGRMLPVFHFHEATVETLEPGFQYLAENGYRTVVSDDVAAVARDGRQPDAHSVMLAFDDAWASLWTIVGPLLKKYDLRAVTYAIPARITDASEVRPTYEDAPAAAAIVDHEPTPFVTWPELVALSNSGRVDVQSHTWSHTMMFCGDKTVGLVDAKFAREPRLNRPRLNDADPPVFLDPTQTGLPLFARRSRMSDARRFFPDDACYSRVERNPIAPITDDFPGRWESDAERAAAIEHELVAARESLETRLRTRVRHVCLPWGVSGTLTRAALERLGFLTAFANRLPGRFAVAAGDDPFFLKRLNGRHLFALPGRGRRTMVSLA